MLLPQKRCYASQRAKQTVSPSPSPYISYSAPWTAISILRLLKLVHVFLQLYTKPPERSITRSECLYVFLGFDLKRTLLNPDWRVGGWQEQGWAGQLDVRVLSCVVGMDILWLEHPCAPHTLKTSAMAPVSGQGRCSLGLFPTGSHPIGLAAWHSTKPWSLGSLLSASTFSTWTSPLLLSSQFYYSRVQPKPTSPLKLS